MTRQTSRLLTRVVLAACVLLSAFGINRAPANAATEVPGRLLFAREGDLWVWTGGETKRILQSVAASDPRWSPDGRRIIYVESGNSYSDLYVYNVPEGASTQITFNQPDYEQGTPEYAAAAAWAIDPDWSASGLIGYMSDAYSEDETFQLYLIAALGDGAYLAPAAQIEDNIDSLSLSSDGLLAAYTVRLRLDTGASENRVYLRDLNDGVAYPLARGRNAFDPAISPSQQTIAVSIRDKRTDRSDVFLVDRATGELTRVTRDMNATNATWSPDGRWLAFVRMVDFQFEIWVAPVENGDPGKPVKLFTARDLDARSGLSWTLTTA